MTIVLFIAAGIVVLGLALVWFANADVKTVKTVLLGVGGAALAALLGWLAVTGRLFALLPFALLFAPLILRLRAEMRRRAAARGPSPGTTSRLRTAMLDCVLDIDTGEVDAEVLVGRHAGRRLSSLAYDELLELLSDAHGSDPPSADVIEAYMDRTLGPDWREEPEAERRRGQQAAGERAASSSGGPLSYEEALAVLGVDESADEDAIKAAHRRLMRNVHPDHGGSDWIAAKINEARDVLLSRLRKTTRT